jgi:hypothetical protein
MRQALAPTFELDRRSSHLRSVGGTGDYLPYLTHKSACGLARALAVALPASALLWLGAVLLFLSVTH